MSNHGPYDHTKIEKKWQKYWASKKIFQAKDKSDSKKFYALIEFPYPSGDGLHVGHPRPYIGMDVISHKRRMQGYNVLYPIGWDAFGLPTENYAIKTGVHPEVVTKNNTDTFRRQIQSLGISFDWSREINTTDPKYYKWTQWIFLQLLKKGLAYKKKMAINWCPKDLIGLANEEVIDGKCERCGTPVEKREKEQWMLAITKYAERLDKDLDDVDYLERIKIQQRNWIGKSEGAEIDFEILGSEEKIKVYTTRPDTIFGVTYVVLSPEHPWVSELLGRIQNKMEVEKYISDVKKKTDIERTAVDKEKTGVELKGLKAINPATKEEIPVWIADYVLADYGTGAVMAVPAHDERDNQFAQKYDLPIKEIELKDKKEMTEKYGTSVTKFKLRDWIFSRQRYWGEPIPVVHCEKCGIVPLPEKDLPLKLPKVKNYKPTETGESPLAAISKWVNTKCPRCIEDKKKEKYFIFDFDGVLGDTWNATVEACFAMGDYPTKEESTARIFKHFDNMPDYSRQISKTSEEEEENLRWIKTFGEKMLDHEIDLFHGFIRELKKYKNTKIAVVSSGAKSYVNPTLKKSGLNFSHVLTFEDHSSKEEKVEKVCRDWGVDIKEVFYFTDTKADVYELEGIMDKTKIIGCAWGFQGLEKLKEVLPERQILKNFRDIHNFFNLDCKATRETDTMPNWAGSSWYYLRYTDPKNKKVFADQDKLKYWTPVDWYNGGMEHTTLHLLYSRFWHKFLYDIGVVPTKEPYQKRTSHGLILAQGGEKMSKSKGNVVNPDSIVKTVGADALRVYEMFMGPFDQHIAWDENGIVGTRRFVEKVWKLREKVVEESISSNEMLLHKTIKKVSEDIEDMKFNTAISSMMILTNEMEKQMNLSKSDYQSLLKLLSPFAPHVAEELWSSLGNRQSIFTSTWPMYDPQKLVSTSIKIMVQVNGKIRASLDIGRDLSDKELENEAMNLPEIKKWTEGKEIQKIIIIKGKVVNIVI